MCMRLGCTNDVYEHLYVFRSLFTQSLSQLRPFNIRICGNLQKNGKSSPVNETGNFRVITVGPPSTQRSLEGALLDRLIYARLHVILHRSNASTVWLRKHTGTIASPLMLPAIFGASPIGNGAWCKIDASTVVEAVDYRLIDGGGGG